MSSVRHYRDRVVPIGLRLLVSVCSTWIQSAPATSSVPLTTAATIVVLEPPVAGPACGPADRSPAEMSVRGGLGRQ
jgi:hypothetical protein